MNWLHYLLEANIYLGVFYVAYCLFLNKETHYLLNRLYLALSSIVSFILPVLQLGILLPPLPEPPTASYVVAEQVTNVPAPIAVPVQVTVPAFTLQDGLWYVYLAGAAVCAGLLIIKLISLLKLIRANKVIEMDNYKVVYLKDTDTAFSFFNYLFIGSEANNERTILRHELVHIRQKHSADIMFLEFLKIINWFNPLVYLLQNSLKTQHEYIADEQTVTEEADATSYSSFLVNNAYGLSGPAITHSFYNLNLLKNRIIMLHQKRSGNLARLKYLVAVPIGAALLCASTLGFSKTYGWIDLAPKSTIKLNVQTLPQQKAPVTKKTTKLLPPPIPAGFKPQKTYVNAKGYKIEEGIHRVSGGITLYIVIISDPSGKKMIYDNNQFIVYKGMTDEEKIALDMYGYKFPDVKVSGMVRRNLKTDVVKFPPPIVAPDVPADFKPEKSYVNEKGYKIEEGPFTANGKNYYVAIISDDATGKKIGSYYKGFNAGRINPMLKSKYGYEFPDVKVSSFIPPPEPPPAKVKKDVVKFPPPIVKPNPFSSEFLKFIADNVKYPLEARQKGTRGYVTAELKIDDYMITNSRIVNGIGSGCDEEVLRVLNLFKNKTQVESGTYILSVAFTLADFNDKNPPLQPLPKKDRVNLGQVVITAYSYGKN